MKARRAAPQKRDAEQVAAPSMVAVICALCGSRNVGAVIGETPLTTLPARCSLIAGLVVLLCQMVISELMCAGGGQGTGATLGNADWVELHNLQEDEVDLQGWSLVVGDTGSGQDLLVIPDGTTVPANSFLVLASGPVTPPDGILVVVDPKLRLLRVGQTVELQRPDGTVASYVGPFVPMQLSNVSYGLTNVNDPSGRPPSYTYLQQPTLGAANSAARPLGPFILSVTDMVLPLPLPGRDISVNITVMRNLGEVARVELTYLVNYASLKKTVTTTKLARSKDGAIELYTAVIPHTSFQAGSMVRWYVKAVDKASREMRSPPADDPEAAHYYGTVVEPSINSSVPILYWFTEDAAAALTERGGRGCILFNGSFHDNVLVHRRGVTALAWPKPKLKFLMPTKSFVFEDGAPAVDEFDLQSYYFELGERSYMKETLGLQMFREAGVPASHSFHINVQQNGQFYGLFGFVEIINDDFLQSHGLASSGPLFKSISGEMSNLRWDVATPDLHWYYSKGNRKRMDADWPLLKELTWGLAGGTAVPRSRWLFEHLNLPQVINEMAAQTVLNNQDRCTKNFYMYLHDVTGEWYKLPWDLDGSFGQDNGLGGLPGDKYCVLNCEQWNNPLYCDSEHPQDIEIITPWGPATVPQDPPYKAGGRRRSLMATPGTPPTQVLAPAHVGWDNPDVNLTRNASKLGAHGTYNHLTDALLDVAATRSMYLRRLRTLADSFLASGRLVQMANETYATMRELAEQDARQWKTGISVDRGHEQIIKEYIPTRTNQLLGKLYGPTGTIPLLPEAQQQADTRATRIARFERSDTIYEQYVEIRSDASAAVDISGWTLRSAGGQQDTMFTFAAGTVVPPAWTLYVTPGVQHFRNRTTSPTGGEGHFVVGPMELIPQGAGLLVLQDDAQQQVHQLNIAA